jgi:predicted membrane protein
MNSRSRLSPQIVLGLIIIGIGTLFLLDNFGMVYAEDYLRFWPALLVIYGLVKVVFPERPSSRFWGAMLALFGALLLARRLHWVYVDPWELWPIFLIAIGGMMLWKSSMRGRNATTLPGSASEDSIIQGTAIMSGFRRVSSSQDFRGGELTAIMGGVEVDLRGAGLKQEAVINVFAFWGGIEMKVPQDWTVIVRGTPIMGGIEHKAFPGKQDPAKRLIIDGQVIMGGVEISN